MEELSRNREAWLGSEGMVAADGGASDGGDILLNPIANPTQPEDQWYNFCHSSTRFFVEETFGRWKNRFRFLLYRLDCSHRHAPRLIYASMVLHNFLTIHKDDSVDYVHISISTSRSVGRDCSQTPDCSILSCALQKSYSWP